MMLSFLARSTVLAILFVGTVGENPVSKVIKLLEDLKKEVETDGSKEAKAYGEFACFCKDTTKKKSDSIIKGEDKISTLSADITDNTASKEEKETEVKERKEEHEKLGDALTTTVSRCAKSQAEFEYGDADMAKALASLEKAIKAMKAKKSSIGLASKDVKHSLAVADAKKLVPVEQQKVVSTFLELDPSDPAYKYHSKEINDILAKLEKDFKDEKKAGEDEWKKTSEACQLEKDGLAKKMKDNLDAITKAEEKIAELKKQISKDRGDLVNAQGAMQEDEIYLKELTAQCEAKANDFDQRAAMRNNEITALTQALAILDKKVKDNDKVNRKLFIQKSAAVVQAHGAPLAAPISFLQAEPAKVLTNFLAKGGESASEQAMKEGVINLLRVEGSRLSSPVLSAMAMQIAGDPFKKVKALIQGLIERLLDEEKAEASKKGFCDTELGKAQKDRDHSKQKASSMSAELSDLEATKDELEAELKELAKGIEKTEKALKEALELRNKEKKENQEILKKANDGLEALNEAILVLKSFYSKASRARVLLQGPVDDDTSGPGFGGAYKGKQESSEAIFALLETIAGDFQGTIDKTEQAEAKAAADFVKFDRTSKEDIGSKETKTKLDKQDLKSTNTNIEKTLDDLKTQMGLLDDSLKMIESLKSTCLDAGGMNYKERVDKRNTEIAALEKALCILDPSKKEGECK